MIARNTDIHVQEHIRRCAAIAKAVAKDEKRKKAEAKKLAGNGNVTLEDLVRLQQEKPAVRYLAPSVGADIEVLERIRQARTISAEEEQRRRDDQERRRRAGLVKAIAGEMGTRYSPERVRLEKFEATFPEQIIVKQRVAAMMETLPEMIRAGRSIIFYGEVGTGKDHLLASLLYRAAAEGFECKYLVGHRFYGELRDRMNKGLKEQELFEHYSSYPVLAISDPTPPAGELTEFRTDMLCRLVDERYRCLLPTWITMNARDRDHADEQLSSRVWDRLQDFAEVVECFWPSYREGKGA